MSGLKAIFLIYNRKETPNLKCSQRIKTCDTVTNCCLPGEKREMELLGEAPSTLLHPPRSVGGGQGSGRAVPSGLDPSRPSVRAVG